jgi:hypothetical protein
MCEIKRKQSSKDTALRFYHAYRMLMSPARRRTLNFMSNEEYDLYVNSVDFWGDEMLNFRPAKKLRYVDNETAENRSCVEFLDETWVTLSLIRSINVPNGDRRMVSLFECVEDGQWYIMAHRQIDTVIPVLLSNDIGMINTYCPYGMVRIGGASFIDRSGSIDKKKVEQLKDIVSVMMSKLDILYSPEKLYHLLVTFNRLCTDPEYNH